MKIDEFVKKLNLADEALASAPQKGFVNLDQVKTIIQETRLFLEEISPRYELGVKLDRDLRESMLAKLKALKVAGAGTMVSEAERALTAGDCDFERLKSLQAEIDESLRKVFGGQSRSFAVGKETERNQPRKPEDYR